MLRALIITPDAGLAGSLSRALNGFAVDVSVRRVLDRYPEAGELSQLLKAHGPSAVFLGFQDPAQAAITARRIAAEVREMPVIAIHATCAPPVLREAMRAGVREFLTPPFDGGAIRQALGEVLCLLDQRPVCYGATDLLVAFLPAKAGAGASTLALYVSAALAAQGSGRALLADLDLNSGVQRLLLGLSNPYSVVDAVAHASGLDERTWPGYVTACGKLDVLHSGPCNPAVRLEQDRVGEFLQFLRRNYAAIAFDLSGNLERYALDVMQQARHVALVCTPEIPSLYLARERMLFLRELDLEQRVLVVLNRASRKAVFSKAQVEEMLAAPVFADFPNDWKELSSWTVRTEDLKPPPALAEKCQEFAAALLRGPEARPRRKFLEHFTLPRLSQAPWAKS